MSWSRATVVVILAVAVFVGAYDFFALLLGGSDATISLTIYRWAEWSHLVTYMLGFGNGFLVYHLFAHRQETKP